MNARAEPASRPLGRSALIYNLAGIAVLVLLLCVAVAYLIDELGRADRRPVPSLGDTNPVTLTLSGRDLSIPQSWFRYGEQIRAGFTDQVDLQVPLSVDGTSAMSVDISLLPRSRARTSASLLDSVYLHQFGEGSLEGVIGLVGKPMHDDDGFTGESVWYDALSPNPFVAKCLDPVETGGAAQCVRTVYLPSGIAAVYRFDAAMLPSWRQFDGEMERWLSAINAW